MQFPEDENGDVLRRMKESGMDLTVEHKIDFCHLFPDFTKATSMCDCVRRKGLTAEVEANNTAGGFDVRVAVTMIPTHGKITQVERQLNDLADQTGGTG